MLFVTHFFFKFYLQSDKQFIQELFRPVNENGECFLSEMSKVFMTGIVLSKFLKVDCNGPQSLLIIVEYLPLEILGSYLALGYF